MPKTPEELESSLNDVLAKLKAESEARAALEKGLQTAEERVKSFEAAKADLAKRLEAAEALKAEFEKLKAAPPKPSDPHKEEDIGDIDSILSDDDRKLAEAAFVKLTDEQKKWVVSDKKNRAQFLSDVVGKKSEAEGGSLLFPVASKPNLSIRDQIRKALNLEMAEDVPAGGPSARTPNRKAKDKEDAHEIITSVPNGDILGALKTRSGTKPPETK